MEYISYTQKWKNVESVIFLKTVKLNRNELYKGAKLIQDGEIVAFPTDTVYGLGADATNNEAVQKIFKAKGRPPINRLVCWSLNTKTLKNML